jgi:hypothetical protein
MILIQLYLDDLLLLFTPSESEDIFSNLYVRQHSLWLNRESNWRENISNFLAMLLNFLLDGELVYLPVEDTIGYHGHYRQHSAISNTATLHHHYYFVSTAMQLQLHLSCAQHSSTNLALSKMFGTLKLLPFRQTQLRSVGQNITIRPHIRLPIRPTTIVVIGGKIGDTQD